MEKDGVDLNDEGERCVRQIHSGVGGNPEARYDAGLVQQQLIRAPLRVVQEHVKEVVNEIPEEKNSLHSFIM